MEDDAPAEGVSTSIGRRAFPFLWDDRGTALVCLLIGAAIYLLADSQASESSTLIPGSEHPVIQGTFYPRVVSVLIMLSSAVLLAVESARLKRGGERSPWMLARLPGAVVLGSLLLLGSVGVLALLIEPLGFLIPVVVLSTFLARWFGAPNWRSAILASSIGTALIYLLFTLVFDSPLPDAAILRGTQ